MGAAVGGATGFIWVGAAALPIHCFRPGVVVSHPLGRAIAKISMQMNYALYAAVAIGVVYHTAGDARSQTSTIQQSVTVNHEGSSATVSDHTASVDVSATGRGRVVGDGQPASEQRPISPVASINADGAFALTLKIGPVPGLTIETDKNLLSIIKTDIANGRLHIFTDRSYSVAGRIKITVISPRVTDISASGSNQINGEGLIGGPLSIALNGSNRATLSRNISVLTCRLSGSNNLTAQQLTADSADVAISGSGAASVDANHQIVAEISGAGSLTVYGNPQARSTQVNGSGKITFVQ